MKQDLSSHQFKEVYENLGIDTNHLGCIMLDTESITVSDVIEEADLYYARDPEAHPYVDGNVSENVPHVTLLYGLLSPGPAMKKHVDAVLDDWQISGLTIAHVTAFESKVETEPYFCLVAELELTDELLEGNARLRFLPHIDTFPKYRAHITLAYIKKDEATKDEYVATLNERLSGKSVGIRALNYGG